LPRDNQAGIRKINEPSKEELGDSNKIFQKWRK